MVKSKEGDVLLCGC